MNLVFDVNELTVDDGIEIETLCGQAVGEIDWKRPSMALVKAMIYVTERRHNPDFTFEDAGKVKITSIEVTEPNPTDAGAGS